MRSATSGSKNVRAEKIVLIGPASSGKTSLVNRFTRNTFTTDGSATIGAAFLAKNVTVNDTEIKLEIWDTGGSEKYRSLAPMYYRDARGAIIVFDLSSEQSFKEAAEWLTEFRERGQPNTIVACAANKVDLPNRAVSEDAFKEFMFKNQIDVSRETSAMLGTNVNELFMSLAEQLLLLPAPAGNDVYVLDEEPAPKSNQCC